LEHKGGLLWSEALFVVVALSPIFIGLTFLAIIIPNFILP